MAQAFRQVDEGFDHVVKGETNEEMIKRLKEWGAKAQTIVPIVRIGVGAEKPEWDLPEGTPETLKLKEDTYINQNYLIFSMKSNYMMIIILNLMVIIKYVNYQKL